MNVATVIVLIHAVLNLSQAEKWTRCPDMSWIEHEFACYKLMRKPNDDYLKREWDDGRMACEAEHVEATLPWFANEKEHDDWEWFIDSVDIKNEWQVWIGITDRGTGGDFTLEPREGLSCGSTPFTKWSRGNPDNGNGYGEHCVEYYHGLKGNGSKEQAWMEPNTCNDAPCESTKQVICQIHLVDHQWCRV